MKVPYSYVTSTYVCLYCYMLRIYRGIYIADLESDEQSHHLDSSDKHHEIFFRIVFLIVRMLLQ